MYMLSISIYIIQDDNGHVKSRSGFDIKIVNAFYFYIF